MEVDGESSSQPIPMGWNLPKIDESNALVTTTNVPVIRKFLTILDQLDTNVEKLRRDARELHDRRDTLSLSIDVIKNNESLSELDEYEREEVNCYLGRIIDRLSTIDINVKTIRDITQEDALHEVNRLIDLIITNSDRTQARTQCQYYLNCCSDSSNANNEKIIDKKFEMALLGCALDDQKYIKKRLQALMTYLKNLQISPEQ